jgi:hypothetical protein
MDKQELKEFIVTAIEEVSDEILSSNKVQYAVQAARKVFLMRLGVLGQDQETLQAAQQIVTDALRGAAEEISQLESSSQIYEDEE